MEISLINVNIFYKRVTSRFSELFLCLLFLKSNQVILMPERLILGVGLHSASLRVQREFNCLKSSGIVVRVKK